MNEIAWYRDRAGLGALIALMLVAAGCASSSSDTSVTPTTHSATTSESGLYAVDIGTGETSLFLESPDGAVEFALSPETNRIAFEAEDRNGHPQIFVISADGTGLQQLTHEPVAARGSSTWPGSVASSLVDPGDRASARSTILFVPLGARPGGQGSPVEPILRLDGMQGNSHTTRDR
jgi:hypothetical protein